MSYLWFKIKRNVAFKNQICLLSQALACPKGKSCISTNIYQLVCWHCSPLLATWMRIEASSCLHSYPVNLALCLVQTLSCGTLSSWVIDGPQPRKLSPAVQRPLDKKKLKNHIGKSLICIFHYNWVPEIILNVQKQVLFVFKPKQSSHTTELQRQKKEKDKKNFWALIFGCEDVMVLIQMYSENKWRGRDPLSSLCHIYFPRQQAETWWVIET